MRSQKITFKRITSPKGKDFERLWKIYEECFPIRDEREVKRNLKEASGYSFQEDGKYVECFLLSVNVNRKAVGGAIFDYVEGNIRGRKVGFGINWYLFMDKKHRQKGLGKLAHEKRLKIIYELSAKRGINPDLMVCELNNPERMKPEERKKDMNIIYPEERLEFFNKIGFRKVDSSRFNYIQPQLTEKSKPYSGLMLCILPLRKELQNKISTEYLKEFLWLYVWAGFSGIPGSDISGHRNPETDSAYKEMRRQLEAFGRQKKFLLLESLV
jgi:GNAT superfamily N-acetyltransferase